MATVAEPMECDSSLPELDVDKAERFKQEGNAAYKAGDYKQAKALYSQAIFHCPGCATYYGNRSAASLMLEEYGPALDDCTRSTQLDENFTKGYLRAAKCHLMLGNPSLALDFYQKVLSFEPHNGQALQEIHETEKVQNCLERANQSFEKGDYRTALFLMERCLEVAPNCLKFRTLKAEALCYSMKHGDCHAMCNDLIRVDRNNADALFIKAMCYYYQDIPEKATQFFQQALRVAPDHTKSRQAIKKSKLLLAKKEEGNAAFKAGHHQQAYELYTEALAVDPLSMYTNAKLYCNRALVGSKVGNLEDAIEDCTKAIELDPDYTRAYQRRAKLYQDNDQHEEAVRDYEKVLQMDRTRDNQATLKEAKKLLKMSKRKDYYKILGVDKSATSDDIKKAYRRCALRHHPDRHSVAEVEVREAEEKIFKEVSEAYSVLSDPQKKNRYDNGYDLEELSGMDIDPTQIFASMFGGGGGGGFGGGFPGFHSFSFGGGGGGGDSFGFTF